MPSRPGSRRINRSPPHLILRREGDGCRSAIRDGAPIHGRRSLRKSWPRYFTQTLKIFSPSSRACLPWRTTHRAALNQESASSIAYCLLPPLCFHSLLVSTRILRQAFSLPSSVNTPRLLRWTNDWILLLQATEENPSWTSWERPHHGGASSLFGDKTLRNCTFHRRRPRGVKKLQKTAGVSTVSYLYYP